VKPTAALIRNVFLSIVRTLQVTKADGVGLDEYAAIAVSGDVYATSSAAEGQRIFRRRDSDLTSYSKSADSPGGFCRWILLWRSMHTQRHGLHTKEIALWLASRQPAHLADW
jgi:hypothetical protein